MEDDPAESLINRDDLSETGTLDSEVSLLPWRFNF